MMLPVRDEGRGGMLESVAGRAAIGGQCLFPRNFRCTPEVSPQILPFSACEQRIQVSS